MEFALLLNQKLHNLKIKMYQLKLESVNNSYSSFEQDPEYTQINIQQVKKIQRNASRHATFS